MTGRQEELAAGWFDGTLAEPERAELLEALRADAGFARAFAEEAELHRGLQFSSLQSGEGDRRAADRILHYVKASQEGTSFAEGVKRRALAAGRRSALRPAASHVGPVIAIAAAVLMAVLIGLLAMTTHRQKETYRRETAERREERARELAPPPEGPKDPAPPKAPVIDDAARRATIEEELRLAAAARRGPEIPKPVEEKPPVPEEKPAVPAPGPDAPVKPAPTRVEPVPAMARLEGVQGEVFLSGERTPAASGADLRDGATVETSGSAVVRLQDGTKLEVSGEATLHEKLAGRRASGKGLSLVKGSVAADVAKQPAGQSLLFLTPHAEILVIGTRLSIQSGAETRVDVHEGQVRVTSLKSGQALMLAAGQGVEVGPAGAPRPFLQGLHAAYFDLNSFKGAAVDRVDAGVDLFLDQAKNEIPPVGADRNFAVRWEGRFLAEAAGDYVFTLAVDGQSKFTIDGQDAVSEPRGTFHPIKRTVIRRRLAAGWHELHLEYSDDQGSSRCVLRYIPPGHRVPDGDLTQGEIPDLEIPARLFSHHRK